MVGNYVLLTIKEKFIAQMPIAREEKLNGQLSK